MQSKQPSPTGGGAGIGTGKGKGAVEAGRGGAGSGSVEEEAGGGTSSSAEGEGRVEGKAETGAEVPSQERRLPLWSKAGCSLPQPLTAQRWANLQLGRLQSRTLRRGWKWCPKSSGLLPEAPGW